MRGSKAPSAAARFHMGRVAAIGCIVCRRAGFGETPAEVHHIRTGTGWGRASHFRTLPLCFHHHRGADGIHTLGTKAWERRYGSEQDLLSEVLALLGHAGDDSQER